MQNELGKARVRRDKRAMRVRKPLRQMEKPRLSVSRSLKHVYAQVIDDMTGITIAGVSSNSKEFASIKGRKEVAKQVGIKLAEMATAKNVKTVVFDRGRYKFHGRIASIAEGAREGGLSF